MTPQHCSTPDGFGDAIARTAPPEGDRLAGLRYALAVAEAAVLAARREEDARLLDGTDRLLAGLELGRKDAGEWSGVDVLAWVKAAWRRIRGGR